MTNYGTRIDYFLLTKGLLPWFKHGDIQPSVKGSDHCPVFIDLHDEIENEAGQRVSLRVAMGMDQSPRDPPRLATRFWIEYSKKQKLLSTFFGKKNKTPDAMCETQQSQSNLSSSFTEEATPPASSIGATDDGDAPITEVSSTTPSPESTSSYFPSNLTATSSRKIDQVQELQASDSANIASKGKRKTQADSNYPAQMPKKSKQEVSSRKSESGKAVIPKGSQQKLSSFFSAPKSHVKEQEVDITHNSDSIDVDAQSDTSEDLLFLSSISSPISVPGSSQPGKKPPTWNQLFAPVDPPRCKVHDEPTREFKVNKPGPNKGKAFFVCSR